MNTFSRMKEVFSRLTRAKANFVAGCYIPKQTKGFPLLAEHSSVPSDKNDTAVNPKPPSVTAGPVLIMGRAVFPCPASAKDIKDLLEECSKNFHKNPSKRPLSSLASYRKIQAEYHDHDHDNETSSQDNISVSRRGP